MLQGRLLVSIMWPDPAKYSDAIQNPSRCFLDPELKACSVETTRLGLPKPSSGQFAVAFELHGNRVFAVKCFTQQIRDQQTRYGEIAKHLKGRTLPMLVDFDYLAQGIRVDGQWYPIVKMEWAAGELLSQYVEAHVGDPPVLRRLAQEWRNVAGLLRQNNMAHGDLQNGNVKIVGGQVKLIDYDGIFVPALRGSPPHEIGVRHFQHPKRTRQDFGPEIDNFSALVIYLSLLAVAAEPRLWSDFFQDENLMLTQADFQAPERTSAWKRLQSSPDQEVRRLARLLADYCRGTVASVPDLETTLTRQPLAAAAGAVPALMHLMSPAPSTPWYQQQIVPPSSTAPTSHQPTVAPWYHQQRLHVPITLPVSNPAAKPTPPARTDNVTMQRILRAIIAISAMLVIADGTGIATVAWPWREGSTTNRWISGVRDHVLAGIDDPSRRAISPPKEAPEVLGDQHLDVYYYRSYASDWEGGWYRGDGEWYGRPWVALYGRNGDYSSAWLHIQIDVVPLEEATLFLDGLDDDWAGTNPIAVEVNGTIIFAGPSPFPNWDGAVPGSSAEWGQRAFAIPTGLLNAGRNTIVVTNLEPGANFSTPPYVLLSDVVIRVQGDGP